MYKILQKLLVIILAVAITGISIQLYKQLYIKYELKQELNKIEKNISEQQKKNSNLLNKVSSLENDDFLKMELKEKLNLKEEGETVVALKQQQDIKFKMQNYKEEEKEKKNWGKWIKILFGW